MHHPEKKGRAAKLARMILASPSPLSVALGIATAAAYGVAAAAATRLGRQGTQGLFALAWVLHALTLGTGLLGREARFGWAPALSVTAWLVLTVYAIERLVYPQLRTRWSLALLGTAAVLLAWWFPGQQHPTLRSPWRKGSTLWMTLRSGRPIC